jgi:hypothetical protein
MVIVYADETAPESEHDGEVQQHQQRNIMLAFVVITYQSVY